MTSACETRRGRAGLTLPLVTLATGPLPFTCEFQFWQQVALLFPFFCYSSNPLFASFFEKKTQLVLIIPPLLPPKQTNFLGSSCYFHLIHMSFHHLFSSSSPLFPGLLFFFASPHPLYQHSAESIASGLVGCPLKRSGGITPLIPLWENKSRGRPVCEISYRQERDGRNQSGGDTQRGLCVGALLNQPCNASFYGEKKPLSTSVISGSLL